MYLFSYLVSLIWIPCTQTLISDVRNKVKLVADPERKMRGCTVRIFFFFQKAISVTKS